MTWRVKPFTAEMDNKMEIIATAQAQVLHLLADYCPAEQEQAEQCRLFTDFANQQADGCQRQCVPGHFTGSAWLVSADGRRALLMHHRKLDRWLQPGGHADGDGDLARVALREAQEETGLPQLTVVPAVFDLDRHRIPARGTEPAHWHYDVRFVVKADGNETFIRNEESLALAWFGIEQLAEDDGWDPSIRRMARKWLER
jgi:8-oxo-dGTP pyrophosphatase MutT (NUDIX family)